MHDIRCLSGRPPALKDRGFGGKKLQRVAITSCTQFQNQNISTVARAVFIPLLSKAARGRRRLRFPRSTVLGVFSPHLRGRGKNRKKACLKIASPPWRHGRDASGRPLLLQLQLLPLSHV